MNGSVNDKSYIVHNSMWSWNNGMEDDTTHGRTNTKTATIWSINSIYKHWQCADMKNIWIPWCEMRKMQSINRKRCLNQIQPECFICSHLFNEISLTCSPDAWNGSESSAWYIIKKPIYIWAERLIPQKSENCCEIQMNDFSWQTASSRDKLYLHSSSSMHKHLF